MAEKKNDPTLKSGSSGPDYPEGTHPARPPSKTTHSSERFEYKDNPDKPDPTTKAQLVVDPLEEGG